MLAIALATLLAAQPAPAPATPPQLAGDWVVDLTAKPGDKPYLKGMSLTLNPDGTASGAFYDSDIQAGRWKRAAGRTCVSFRTTDGQGPYHSAACLADGAAAVTGQTWAEHRNFVFVWNARRATPEDRAQPWW